MKTIIMRNIIEISKNKNYLFRVTAVQSLDLLKDTL